MKRLIESLAFIALAIGVHLALILRFDHSDGAEAGGQGGAAMVSVAAASARIETMVATWEALPETGQTAPHPVAPTVDMADPTPVHPDTRPDLAPVHRTAISLPSAPDNTPAQPEIELSTLPPPEPVQAPPSESLPEPVVAPDPLPASPRDTQRRQRPANAQYPDQKQKTLRNPRRSPDRNPGRQNRRQPHNPHPGRLRHKPLPGQAVQHRLALRGNRRSKR